VRTSVRPLDLRNILQESVKGSMLGACVRPGREEYLESFKIRSQDNVDRLNWFAEINKK
jgi:hypothetical protein